MIVEPDGKPREGVLFITDDEITQPLPGDPRYQAQNDAAYAVFLQAVEIGTRLRKWPTSGSFTI